MAARVCVISKPVPDLSPGDCVVVNGQALYLEERTGRNAGYDEWRFTRYWDSGQVAARGRMSFRHDSSTPVVAFTTDGRVVVP